MILNRKEIKSGPCQSMQKNKTTALKSCGILSTGFATLYQMKLLLRICFLHIKDLSARNKPSFFLRMRKKWHSMNKDPWLFSHKVFLGRKIDLQVNGMWNRTALPLNYPEVFLGKTILVQIKRFKQFGLKRTTLLYPTLLSLGSKLKMELVKK